MIPDFFQGNTTEESSPLSESGTLSSRASSIDLASEEFVDPPQDARTKVDPLVQPQVDLVTQPHSVTSTDLQVNGEVTNSVSTHMTKDEPPDVSQFQVTQNHTVPETNGIAVDTFTADPTSLPSVQMSCHSSVAAEETPKYSNSGVHSDNALTNDSGKNNGIESSPLGLTTGAEGDGQQSTLASYFQASPVQSDPFSFISQTPDNSLSMQVDSTSDSFKGPEDHLPSIADPTVIEPDDLDSQECSQSASVTEPQESIACSSDVGVQPGGSHSKVLAPSTTTSSFDRQVITDSLDRDGSVSSETTASITTAIHLPAGQQPDQPILKSSSESLRQISLQLSGLMNETEGAGKIFFFFSVVCVSL